MTQLSQEFIGSISEGTMRVQDLLPVCIFVLSQADKDHPLVKEYNAIESAAVLLGDATDQDWKVVLEDVGYWDHSLTSTFLNDEVWTALNEVAPAGTSFSSSEGDGASFGFWPYDDDDDDEFPPRSYPEDDDDDEATLDEIVEAEREQFPERFDAEGTYIEDEPDTDPEPVSAPHMEVEACPDCGVEGGNTACYYCTPNPMSLNEAPTPGEVDMGAGPTKPYAWPLHIEWHCLCGDGPQSHVTRAEGEECHGHCQKTEQDCKGFGYRPIMHDARTPAISAMFERAGQLQMPRHYTCDLSTDYQMLIKEGRPERFLWVVRESGTHLYSLDASKDPQWQQSYILTSLEYHQRNHPEAKVFHWNGFTLDPVSIDTARVLAVIPPIQRGPTCHGPTWHSVDCVHRVVSPAPSHDHVHGPGVEVCILCSERERHAILAQRQAERQAEMDEDAARKRSG